MRASIYMQQRDWQNAFKLLLDPQAPLRSYACLWTLFVKLAITTGDYEAAEAALPAAPTTVRDASSLYLFRGQIAEARWDMEQAAASYRQAIAINPDDGGAHFELARVALKLLDLDSCRLHLNRLIEITTSSLLLRGQSLNASQTHAGQLLDEFALDRARIDDLQRIRLLPTDRKLATLKEMVILNPDHTPTAIMLLIALRQAGLIAQTPQPNPNGKFEHIPKRIVQYWSEAEPPMEIAELMNSWQIAHPDFDYFFFNDQNAQNFLREHNLTDVLRAYRRAVEPAQRADIFRLAFLAINGGIYADADDRCIATTSLFLPPEATFVAYQEDYGTLGNNFLAVIPNHPVICLALRLATNAINRGDNDLLWLSTGPGLLSRAFAQIISQPRSEVFENQSATIFDLGFISRHVGIHCPVVYKKTTRHWGNASFKRRRELDCKKIRGISPTLESTQ
jgi:tetratricopeptide (TPR) repeat protein